MSTPNLSYLNTQEIELYYNLYEIKDHITSSAKLTIEVSLFNGPKVSRQTEEKENQFNTLEKLMAVCDFLRTRGLISTERPNSIDLYKDEDFEFIYEKMFAYKLFFPKNKLTEIVGLDHLVVWVAEPDFSKLSEEPWKFRGTFLYLIETLYDRGDFAITLSGCSALQALCNIITGQQFYTINWDEPLGRRSNLHPIEKLKKMGAINLGKQEITTIYRKRYMTDEQCFAHDGKEYRCNDLLGYPLFIS